MKTNQPVLFVSHGAPSLLLDRDPTTNFFASVGKELQKPKYILSISAHWETDVPCVSGHMQPKTIHDFHGFQKELYEITYPCPGSQVLVDKITTCLDAIGFDCQINPDRGLDHGVWVPLKLMFPEADIPVVQLSLQTHKGTEYHYEMGQALQSLSEENVLIIGSGGITHNIRGFGRFELNAPPQDYVFELDRWVKTRIEENDIDSLLNYRVVAPHGDKNHPTEEHFLPLFVAMGAAGDRIGKQVHQGYTYSILSMAAYQWVS